MDGGLWARPIAEIDRALYVLALALALFTLALVVAVRGRSLHARVLQWLRGVSGAIALWAMADLACFWLFARPYLFAVWLPLWLAPPLLWARYGASHSPDSVERWWQWRAFLVVAWLPFVAVAYSTILIAGEAYGYVVFFFAVQLVWWGYATWPGIVGGPSPAGSEARAAAPQRDQEIS